MDQILVKDVMDVIEALAPCNSALDYDNVGLLVGSKSMIVNGIIVGLELTDSLLEEAIESGSNLIVVHHPLIFKPIKKITLEDVTGNKIIRLIQSNIALYVAHTNLDVSPGGLNDYIAKRIGMEIEPFNISGQISNESDLDVIGLSSNIRVGSIKPIRLINLVNELKSKLQLDYLLYTGNEQKMIKRVGLCTGSGISFYNEALEAKVDVYITGDMKYHDATYANDMGIPIIDATHYGSEILVRELFYELLTTHFQKKVVVIRHMSYINPIKII